MKENDVQRSVHTLNYCYQMIYLNRFSPIFTRLKAVCPSVFGFGFSAPVKIDVKSCGVPILSTIIRQSIRKKKDRNDYDRRL